jgi:hypothetical protein
MDIIKVILFLLGKNFLSYNSFNLLLYRKFQLDIKYMLSIQELYSRYHLNIQVRQLILQDNRIQFNIRKFLVLPHLMSMLLLYNNILLHKVL